MILLYQQAGAELCQAHVRISYQLILFGKEGITAQGLRNCDNVQTDTSIFKIARWQRI